MILQGSRGIAEVVLGRVEDRFRSIWFSKNDLEIRWCGEHEGWEAFEKPSAYSTRNITPVPSNAHSANESKNWAKEFIGSKLAFPEVNAYFLIIQFLDLSLSWKREAPMPGESWKNYLECPLRSGSLQDTSRNGYRHVIHLPALGGYRGMLTWW